MKNISLDNTESEHPELEGTDQDHRVQIPALHKGQPQESYHLPERIVQMLLELWQAWSCNHFPMEPNPVSVALWMKNLFLISNLNLP